MGPIGYPEMVFIFVLALLLFGPKKLPELGRTIGKAWTEFNRAKNDMKATFDREMRALERETESIKEVTNTYYNDSYNYDYSNYDASEPPAPFVADSVPALEESTLSASASEGADYSYSTTGVPVGEHSAAGHAALPVHTLPEHATPEHFPAPAGTVASGSLRLHEGAANQPGHPANVVQETTPAD